MIKLIEEIADYKVEKNYQLDKPKGVRGRSSDNSLVIKNWLETKLNIKRRFNRNICLDRKTN